MNFNEINLSALLNFLSLFFIFYLLLLLSMAAEVRCFIRGEDIEEGTECMYYVPLPVTHSVLSELFPFEGRFHFRLKVPGEKLNLIEEFVWLDISPGKEEVTFARSMNTLEIQAIAIDFPRSERPDAEDDYITYMENVNQELGFNPSTRPPRGSLEDRESSSTSKGDLLRKFTKGVKKRTINAAQTIAPLSLHSVTSGASSLWNSVKATASQIQASIKQTSSLTDVSEDNLAQLADDCTCNYNDGNSRHAQLLRDLWAALQLGLNYERVSEKWKEVGWQKTDPVNDLKTSGVLAIRALTYLGRKFPDKCLAMVTKNKANVKANYPFAIVGVNITLLLAELFHLRDHKYRIHSLCTLPVCLSDMIFYVQIFVRSIRTLGLV